VKTQSLVYTETGYHVFDALPSDDELLALAIAERGDRPIRSYKALDDIDLETPGDPIPEGPEEPTTDPITEDDPRVGHEPVEE
jgi:hypothetical protein